jgi:hypothetical protein
MRWRPRRVFSLAFLIASLLSSAGWSSPWLGLLFLVLGVGSVVLDRFERRQRGADDPAVLDLHR